MKLFAEGSPVAQYEIGSQRNFVYLLLDWPTRQAAIVDPQRDFSLPLSDLERHGFTLGAILLTHTHSDHTAGVPGLLTRFPSIGLHGHEKDFHRLHSDVRRRPETRAFDDGATIAIGNLGVTLLHTPGHSAGGCCYLVPGDPGFLLTGDTLFIGDCGRTDLDTGSTSEMFASLQKIRDLPGDPVILPGHHYARECTSTLARERETSPALRCRSVEELARLP